MIFWNTTNIHVVPDGQQYTGLRKAHMLSWIDNSMTGTHQVHLANVDMIPGANVDMIPGINMS